MNYFERLIRRALLETPARPGAPLRDPFEDTAPLDFETPRQAAASPWPERPRAEPVQASSPPPAMSTVETRTGIRDTRRNDDSEPVDAKPISPAPVSPLPLPVVATPTQPEIAGPAELLKADAFMRSLGVAPRELPQSMQTQTLSPQEPHPFVSPRPDHERVVAETPNASPALQMPATIQPQPVPRPLPSATSPTSTGTGIGPAHAQSRAERSPRETPAPHKPVAEIVRETVRIVKVTDPDLVRIAQMGASPPTFGAGQL